MPSAPSKGARGSASKTRERSGFSSVFSMPTPQLGHFLIFKFSNCATVTSSAFCFFSISRSYAKRYQLRVPVGQRNLDHTESMCGLHATHNDVLACLGASGRSHSPAEHTTGTPRQLCAGSRATAVDRRRRNRMASPIASLHDVPSPLCSLAQGMRACDCPAFKQLSRDVSL